jgi:sigma-E factor negative regulatory protein RseC
MSSVISHPGIVKKITKEGAEVVISTESACGTCSSRGACPASEMKEKVILIRDVKVEVAPGDHVNVLMTASLGRLAVIVAYLVPVIVMVSVLFIFHGLGFSDGFTALTSLGTTLLYFGIVWTFRTKLGRTFVFSIEKTSLQITQ